MPETTTTDATAESQEPTVYPARFLPPIPSYVPDPATLDPALAKKARKVIRNARRIIKERGWVQNTASGPSGERCLSQAINEALNGQSVGMSVDVTKAITGMLEGARPKVTRRARPFRHFDSIVTWNDRPGRTKEQVLSLLWKAQKG